MDDKHWPHCLLPSTRATFLVLESGPYRYRTAYEVATLDDSTDARPLSFHPYLLVALHRTSRMCSLHCEVINSRQSHSAVGWSVVVVVVVSQSEDCRNNGENTEFHRSNGELTTRRHCEGLLLLVLALALSFCLDGWMNEWMTFWRIPLKMSLQYFISDGHMYSL